MKVLVPIDDSDCSLRALSFAVEFVRRYEGTLHVVHIANRESETATDVIARAQRLLEEEGVRGHPEIVTDLDVTSPRYGTQIGKDIITLAEDGAYDHIVMGHHGGGVVGRLVLGSAAQTVVESAETPVTVVP